MAKVLIADDHAVVRAGLRQLLSEDRAVSEIGEAATGQQTLDRLRENHWELLILDIGMPDRSGIDILQQIRAVHDRTRVLVLSGFPERQYALNVLRAGASGFIEKTSPPEEMLRAVRAVLHGRRYVSATLADQLVGELDGDANKPPHSRLSEREFQVFCKLAAGRAVSEIAHELCLSVKTVSTYRSRILEKLNFHTNADLTSYALRNGLIN